MNLITTTDELKAALIEMGAGTDAASVFCAAATPAGSDVAGQALDVLVARTNSRDGTVSVRSVRFRHWLLNWRALLLDAAPAASAAAYDGPTVQRFLALLVCLKAMAGAATISLGEDEAKLALLIWSTDEQILDKGKILELSGFSEARFESSIQSLLDIGALEVEEDARIIKVERIIFV